MKFAPKSPFYAILDRGYVSEAKWVETALALLRGGACLLQVRAKHASACERRRLTEAVLPHCREWKTPLIVNDDCDLACDLPDCGLHLGQDDLDIGEARSRLGPDRLLGLSTHSPEQIQGALDRQELLSYFAVGPVFPTATKPDYQPVGLGLIRFAAGLHPSLPWFCIGGIGVANLPLVRAAGASAWVVVSEVLMAADVEEKARFFSLES